jgi:hypothetical protein
MTLVKITKNMGLCRNIEKEPGPRHSSEHWWNGIAIR